VTSAAVRIDPRLRARRIAVRRAEGRRRLRFVLVGASLVTVAVFAWAISRSALLDLDHVRVEGIGTVSAASIRETIRSPRGTPLMDLDLQTIEAEVAALPWVESVDASREWPGTLRLDVVERVPVAAIPDGDDSFVLLDAQGVAMATAAGTPSLPVIASAATGQLGSVQSVGIPALAVVAELTDDLVSWVDTITISGTATDPRLGLDLVGGAVVDLGDEHLLADKIGALRAVLSGADLSCVDLIDVRVADLTTIARDPVCDAVTGAADAGGAEASG